MWYYRYVIPQILILDERNSYQQSISISKRFKNRLKFYRLRFRNRYDSRQLSSRMRFRKSSTENKIMVAAIGLSRADFWDSSARKSAIDAGETREMMRNKLSRIFNYLQLPTAIYFCPYAKPC
jgi:hypothetical protein